MRLELACRLQEKDGDDVKISQIEISFTTFLVGMI
jgi:hypothetical protein